MDNISFIDVFLNGQLVGKLAITPQSLCAFEYDADYMKDGVSISPLLIPIKPGLFIAKRDPFNGGFGVFDDSLPDGWGNLILDRYLQQIGINPYKLTLLQRLSIIGSSGRGALEYRPEKCFDTEESSVDFNKLANETEKILTSEYTVESLKTLYHYGGTSGGARPKIFIKIDDKEWLVKFKATNDPEDIGKTEYEYSLLAKECGIEMPETKLFEEKYFGVTRFDRTPKGKVHTISAAGLLNANYRIPSLDYLILLKVCRQITLDMEQVCALFRQMVFNVAISNRDDHAKNFSFQLHDNQWKLSPAYDLLPGNGFNGFHTTTINGKGEPTLNDIMIVASTIGLNKQRTLAIIDEIITKCSDKNMLNFRLK
jgi:serine/threonine-protein kinase HipA